MIFSLDHLFLKSKKIKMDDKCMFISFLEIKLKKDKKSAKHPSAEIISRFQSEDFRNVWKI